uniref:Flavodoxin-like fold domain-containing protein n=1 Tax=Chromera velia CCMP2878 TaxID=1169474 RepID=A0A0G4IFI0_9ALVE|eukprot:Cvel_14021.t1-p1 / transcript=Cvel_14021.t1 / gene=Cvel_14021 / organism=Chromera_velia_CCMP2878 / gene_product=hypothetical protein / transcript_product=hypothetical protein / location=Cvel_scaffold981:53131-54207(+) / protein_length=359 / sequence_SO=supercontig / SO=protein_coding / is_pseudo=false
MSRWIIQLQEGIGKLYRALSLVCSLLYNDFLLSFCPGWHRRFLERVNRTRRRPLYRPSKSPDKVLIVVAHPLEKEKESKRSGKRERSSGSLSGLLVTFWEESLQAASIKYQTVYLTDRMKTGLHGVEELQGAKGKGEGWSDTFVKELQEQVDQCGFLVFVHPVYWYDVPSQLKAFEEKVLSAGFAFVKLPSAPLLMTAAVLVSYIPGVRFFMRRFSSHGLLRDKRAFVSRTLGGPDAGLRVFGHNATTLESTLKFCGVRSVKVQSLDLIDEWPFSLSTPVPREEDTQTDASAAALNEEASAQRERERILAWHRRKIEGFVLQIQKEIANSSAPGTSHRAPQDREEATKTGGVGVTKRRE